MKKSTLIILFIFIILQGYARTDIVFVDKTNVREKPSLSSKVIGTLAMNTEILRCERGHSKRDSIGGNVSFWVPIKYNGGVGYIWERTLAITSFKSELKRENTFLFGLTPKNKAVFKVFQKGVFIKEFTFDKVYKWRWYTKISAYSIGETYNSRGKEIIVLFDNADRNNYILLEWDGKILIQSKIKLRDDSFIVTGHLHPNPNPNYDYCIIKKSNVNIRSKANLTSKKIATLPLFTHVKLIEKGTKLDTVNNKMGLWHLIEWNNKKAYIWSDLLSIPVSYIKSNKTDSLSFLYTFGAIYVFKGDEIIYQYLIPKDYHVEYLHELGSMGLGDDYQFIGAEMVGYTEGHDYGIKLYLWDGKEIKYIGFDGGWGDIGVGEYTVYSFPNTNGLGKIIKNHSYAVKLNYPAKDSFSDNSMYFYLENQYQIMKLKDDTLIEIPSKHSRLRQIVSERYPMHNHKLMHYTYGDINGDSLEDVLCFIVTVDAHNDYYYDSKDAILAVIYGKPDSSFYFAYSNNAIVETHFSGVSFEIKHGEFSVAVVYNSGAETLDIKVPLLTKFDFKYNGSDSTIIWQSVTEGSTKGNRYYSYDAPWNLTKKHFKSTKITFEKAWTNSEFVKKRSR